MRTLIILVTISVAIVIGTGCSGHHSSAGHFQDVPDKGLAYTDTLEYTFDDLDSLSERRLYIAVVHSDEYPYCNLWLEVHYADSATNVCDTVGMTLADEYGLWQGTGIGNSYQMEVPLEGGLNPSSGSHVRITHIMRADTLRGLTRIGVLAK